MIRHLLKLAWNRKRANALVMLEIFASFLVLCTVITLSAWLGYLYHLPTGYDPRSVWCVSLSRGGAERTPDAAERAIFDRLVQETRGLPGVQSAALAQSVPYDGHVWDGSWKTDGREFEAEFDEASEDFDKVLGMKLVAGRWFERADDDRPWRPVIVNRTAARAWFDTQDPVGKTISKEKDKPESRIVGVVEDFRKGGELSPPGNFVIRRLVVGDPDGFPPEEIVVKVAEGSDASLEQAILGRLRAVAPTWSFHLSTLEEMRSGRFRERLVPLLVGGVICGFLLMMVGLGLIGVLWQNVATRTQEIGIRRAAGASGAAVRRQVLLEVFLTTTVSLLVATLIVAQVPLLGLIPYLSMGVTLTGLALSIVLMYVITFLCGYFPSWMATLVEPAGALRAD